MFSKNHFLVFIVGLFVAGLFVLFLPQNTSAGPVLAPGCCITNGGQCSPSCGGVGNICQHPGTSMSSINQCNRTINPDSCGGDPENDENRDCYIEGVLCLEFASNRGVCLTETPVNVLTCVGFESPMDGGPVTVKKNRVLPFKAVLQDQDANPVTDLDITSLPVIQVLFDSVVGPAIDVTGDALQAGQGTEGNLFEFGTDKWQFNLKTKNYTASGTFLIF